MTMGQAARACEALRGLMEIKGLRGAEVLALLRLRDSLKPVVEAVCNRERMIAERFADKGEDGAPIIEDGVIRVSDPRREREARAEMLALRRETADDIPGKISIDLSALEERLPVSAGDIDALREFIDFGGVSSEA